jgi:hypothetical protein
VRPRAGGTPSTSKKFQATRPICSCSGSPSPARAAEAGAIAATPCSVVAADWKSMTSGPARLARAMPPTTMFA